MDLKKEKETADYADYADFGLSKSVWFENKLVSKICKEIYKDKKV